MHQEKLMPGVGMRDETLKTFAVQVEFVTREHLFI